LQRGKPRDNTFRCPEARTFCRRAPQTRDALSPQWPGSYLSAPAMVSIFDGGFRVGATVCGKECVHRARFLPSPMHLEDPCIGAPQRSGSYRYDIANANLPPNCVVTSPRTACTDGCILARDGHAAALEIRGRTRSAQCSRPGHRGQSCGNTLPRPGMLASRTPSPSPASIRSTGPAHMFDDEVKFTHVRLNPHNGAARAIDAGPTKR